MCCQQVLHRVGLPTGHSIVSRKRITYLLNLRRQPEHSPAIKHRSHLLNAQGIVFDGKRGLNGSNPIAASKLRGKAALLLCAQTPNQLADLGH